MKNNKYFRLLALALVAASLLNACAGALPPASTDDAIPTVAVITTDTPAVPVASPTAQTGGAVEVEIFGIVESMTETTVTVNGVTYNIVANFTELKDVISVGDQVKVHVIANSDGTFTIREIEISLADDNGNTNNNSNDTNSNDDNGNESNSNDDNSNDSNSNDDNGNDSNSNEDNSNDSNSNDDYGGNNNNSGGSGGNDNDDGGGNNNDSNDNG